MITGEEAIDTLRNLKESARIFDTYEYDIFEDYRNVAEHELREIIETLLNLDI